MKIKIEIACDNAAFGENEEDCKQELARIIMELGEIQLINNGLTNQNLFDINGNKVGTMKVTND